jgi:acetoin utilization deacetylase AcuC-like enzyme
MTVLALTHPLFLQHDPGPGHPESPARLSRTLSLLKSTPILGVELQAPRPATVAEIGAVHTDRLREELAELDGREAFIDADTATSADSYRAALLAAGAASVCAEEVMAGRAQSAFALVRPPGHHAEPDRAMGFCLINNAAVAAEAALRHGAERVLLLDWDVHHGNGTQACFYRRRDVLYQSMHQFPFYPGTGSLAETGEGPGEGFTVNCPLPAGMGDAEYGAAMHDLFLPVAHAYKPSVVIVSAGFDPHWDDPLGGMKVTERGFAAMASAMRQLANETCQGRLILLLEGGYSLEGLSQSVHACLEVLAGRDETFPDGASPRGASALRSALNAQKTYWPLT